MDAEMAPALAADAAKRPQVSKYYYKKRATSHSRNGKADPNHPSKIQLRSALARQPLSSPAIPTHDTGGFYEIDHDKLPPKSPIHLKSIRVVKVSESTSLDVTVSFPSLLALRSYFSLPASGAGPELDERFVMSRNHAARILRRRVADEELAGEMRQDSFWLVAPRLYDFTPPQPLPSTLVSPAQPAPQAAAPPASSCLVSLQCNGMGWGVRRRVKYICRHRNAILATDGYDTEASVKEEVQRPVQVDMTTRNSKKRKLEAAESSKHRDKREKRKSGRSTKRPKKVQKAHRKERKRVAEADESDPRRGKDRWSAERYAAAEASLLRIMRARGACIGAPVLRQTLREEARKHIGDTGLLDHLLKHMAGKVAEDGTQRFRRRHNADGAMEYWLEPAELATVRREAGVTDPYWVPPPGWKPGDGLSPVSCDPQLKRQVEELTEEVIGVKRHVEQLSSDLMQVGMEAKSQAARAYSAWKEKYESTVQTNGKLEKQVLSLEEKYRSLVQTTDKLEKQVLSLEEKYESVVQTNDKLEAEVLSFKEKYETMVEKSAKLEEQLATFSSSFLSLKEELPLLKNGDKHKIEIDHVAEAAQEPGKSESSHDCKQEVGTGKPPDNAAGLSNQLQPGDATGIDAHSGSGNGSARVRGKMARKSSFRICKPQGTFLWPYMASGMTISGAGNSSSPIVGPGLPPSARASAEVVVANAEATANFASMDEHMMVGGLPTPPSASSTNAASTKQLLLPSPSSPARLPPLPANSAGTVPIARPYSGVDMSNMEASSSSSVPCSASLLEEKKAMFDGEAGGSNVGTELALATPSYC